MGLLSRIEDIGGGLLGMNNPQAAPQAAPQPQSGMGYDPSWWETLQGVLFNGQSPADAAMSARMRHYNLLRQQMLTSALQAAPPDRQLAMMLAPDKEGEALASHDTSMLMKGGETRNNGVGSPTNYTAPLQGFDEKSGRAYSITPQGMTASDQGLGGDVSVTPNGAVVSGRQGVLGGVPVPEKVGPGESLYPFNPAGNMSGAAAAPAPTAAAAPITGAPNVTPRAFRLADAQRALQVLAPGARITSGYRTPQHNAAVGGVPGSLHTEGQAIDFVPPPGVSFGQFRAALQAKGLPASELIDEGDHIHWAFGPKGQGASAAAAPAAAPAPGGMIGPALVRGATTTQLSPAAAAAAGFPKGAVVERDPAGKMNVVEQPQYGAEWAKGTRQQFLESEAYKQNESASSALQALQKNVGQMTGPAAYTLLDTMARTINPGAVARQGTIAAIEDMLGLPAHITGSLLNIQGKGRIPLKTQQAILDAVTPFAQAHWDQAKALSDANSALASRNGANPEDVTAPIGERPQSRKIGQAAAGVPPPAQRRIGQVYPTPRGNMKWTGTGWLPAN